MKRQRANSYLNSANAPFIETLYARYLQDPNSVSADWREYFTRMAAGQAPDSSLEHDQVREAFRHVDRIRSRHPVTASTDPVAQDKQVAVLQLINAYRFRGHEMADVDPLSLRDRTPVPELDPVFHKLDQQDLTQIFKTGSLAGPLESRLSEILNILRDSYCGHFSAEYMHITDTQQKRWVQQRMESVRGRPELPLEEKRYILDRLMAAAEFEKYLHHRYVGQKRFSLEGAESLIPMLDALIQRAGANKVEEIIVGMAHRGRLNVLTNILGKAPSQLFQEFEGSHDHGHPGSGDVKYHMGFSSDIDTEGERVHLALGFNPSHLEIIGPVIEGSVRARQHRRQDKTGSKVLPVVIHGDAAFSGQGVVMETLNMSQARGYTTGGTLHIIINNQIGFTTSNPLDARSTTYCTEVARMVQAPIFHVNGDDPEAAVFVMRMALDYRMVYRKDVVIDLVCYRRHGHSEADEPAATQPMMYHKIREHEGVVKLYGDKLIESQTLTGADIDAMANSYRSKLDRGELVAPNIVTKPLDRPYIDWSRHIKADPDQATDTAIPADTIKRLAEKLDSLPEGFVVHPYVRRILDDRLKMADGQMPFDWGFAETMAYASLVQQGVPVRLSGQDSGRGTFFHRHAILHDQKTGNAYIPLQHIVDDAQRFIIIDSMLSEEAVLAFEYGYSTAAPDGLTIWEAQFGDFANGAQVVIDQFIISGEAKWGRLCGLVVFLPHGFDGQGPEHSSARLERFLTLCAEDNIQVCVPSLPSQWFHLLRRQVLRDQRKPLVIMTPKSLLRHKLSTSSLEEMTGGGFRKLIGETQPVDQQQVRRVVICSGKVYYDVHEARQKRGVEDVAILRVEQLYPLPRSELLDALKQYPNVQDIVWCQEEPANQGAWTFMRTHLQELIGSRQRLHYAGRPAAASPAVGSYKKHIEQLQNLIDQALGG